MFIQKLRYHISKNVVIKRYLKILYWLLRITIYYVYQPDQKLFDKNVIVKKKISGFTGYYDKQCFSPDETKILLNRIKDNLNYLMLVDLKSFEEVEIGSSRAWNYQQGSMAEWLDHEYVIYNDFIDGNLVAVIQSTLHQEKKYIRDRAIQCSLKSDWNFISINYDKFIKLRPDYSYRSISKNYNALSDDSDGIWLIDGDGVEKLLVSLARLKALYNLNCDVEAKINHVSTNESGSKIIFLFRYFKNSTKNSILLYYDIACNSLKHVHAGVISHYCWVSESDFVMWHRDKTGGQLSMVNVNDLSLSNIFEQISDGHPVKDGDQILFDSYADWKNLMTLQKIDLESRLLEPVIKVLNKPTLKVEQRCDAHPKISQTHIAIDCFDSNGRNVLILKKLIE